MVSVFVAGEGAGSIQGFSSSVAEDASVCHIIRYGAWKRCFPTLEVNYQCQAINSLCRHAQQQQELQHPVAPSSHYCTN